jgi:hypothetical protein
MAASAQPAGQQFAATFQNRIGGSGDQMGVHPFQVAQRVQVQGAGFDTVDPALPQMLEMR